MKALPLSLDTVSVRQRGRLRLASIVLTVAVLLGVSAPGAARAEEPVHGTVNVYTDGGYTRVLFRLDEEVPARVDVAGAILVIKFKKPVDVAVERINAGAPDYISAARRDPDGTAVRIALARKVKINTIPAGERFYVDLLPETWTGIKPGLPQEVIDDLTRRTREAERQLQTRRHNVQQRTPPLVRVRVAQQPTFVRYVFDMPDSANVVPEQSDGKLTLNFDQPIRWDLADAKATMPPTLESIDVAGEFDSVAVNFVLNGAPEVHTFREDRSMVVDIGTGAAKPKETVEQGAGKQAAAAKSSLAIEPPETVPASKDAPPATSTPNPGPEMKMAAPKGEPLRPDTPASTAQAPEAEAPKSASAKVETLKIDLSNPGAIAKVLAPPPAATKTVAPAAASAAKESPKAATPVPSVALPAAAPSAVAPVQPKIAVPVTDTNAGLPVGLSQSGTGLQLDFPFAAPTPAAVFRRADTVWLVFDTAAKLNLAALAAEAGKGIREAKQERGADGEAIIRLKLTRPRLVSLAADGPGWAVTIADTVTAPTQPLSMVRTVLGKAQTSLSIPFDSPGKLHVLRDPDIGDRLMVITALAPARGFLKQQDFVELHALASTHGVVVQPLADDLAAELEPDRIALGRPNGLSVSSTTSAGEQELASTFRSLTFDPQTWGFDRQAPFNARQSELIRLAAAAPDNKRKQARLNLARFYLARDMGSEAKGVIDVALDEQRDTDDVTGSILRAVAEVMMNRPDQALKVLSGPQVGSQQDAPVWRAIAFAREGKWAEARQAFKAAGAALASLPIELQRMAMQDSLRAAIEVGDFSAASQIMNEFTTVGVPPEMEPSINVLAGRLNEGLGRNDEAITSYRAAAAADDRRAAAQGRLREIALMSRGDMPRKDVIGALETLTTVWRGDETETEGLKLLAHLYTKESRYRDAFHVMKTALMAHPNSDMTRKIQDEAAHTFDSLFLEGKGDALPPIEALGLFYDYRELTPIGRRGDEMIRRLADRLVAVDLLDQATELLQHQVDHRLHGAARSQVATRLAVIYLMNSKPGRALATLRSTRSGGLANELRDQRLLLEARALSDTGRHDLALELVANIKGPEVIRLRADILWAAKRWRRAAEQIELLHGERWREFAPLTDGERTDILRAGIGYALGDEPIGLGRLRQKYAAKMADGPDGRTFDVVTAPVGTGGVEFQDVAKRLASIDTLQAFLRDIRKRYPDAPPQPLGPDSPKEAARPETPKPAKTDAKPEAAAPRAGADQSASNASKPDPGSSPLPPKPPASVPLRPDMSPTGSIIKLPKKPRPAKL